jgi:acyl-CoA hydrolase
MPPSFPLSLTSADLSRWLRPGARVYWPGCVGASPLFERWLMHTPALAAGVQFCGVWIPGVNQFDPTALHADARAQTFFLGPHLHAGQQRGAIDHLPWHYTQIAADFAQPQRFDVLMLHVAPPDADGQCSFSVSADFGPVALQGADAHTVVLAHINPRLPRTAGPSLPVSRITAWVHADEALLTVADATAHAPLVTVARHVAALVRDGDTLQFGLGKLQAAVMAALTSHRQLRIHSGMVSDGVLGLIEAGALALTVPAITTGVALGSPRLYGRLADPLLARFAPVSHTHALATLAELRCFTAINSAIEVDLYGNVNATHIDGRCVSGVGGLLNFARGARAGDGGRTVFGMPACTGTTRRSRIVPRLAAEQIAVPGEWVDHVVTEFGVATLRGLSADARAQTLISIAAPQHQDTLRAAWAEMRIASPGHAP